MTNEPCFFHSASDRFHSVLSQAATETGELMQSASRSRFLLAKQFLGVETALLCVIADNCEVFNSQEVIKTIQRRQSGSFAK